MNKGHPCENMVALSSCTTASAISCRCVKDLYFTGKPPDFARTAWNKGVEPFKKGWVQHKHQEHFASTVRSPASRARRAGLLFAAFVHWELYSAVLHSEGSIVMLRSLFVLCLAMMVLSSSTLAFPAEQNESVIRNILQEEVTAWNRGDTDGYSRYFAENGTFTNV